MEGRTEGATTEEMTMQQAAFWESKSTTVDGMLDGFGKLDKPDTMSSLAFIDTLFQPEETRGALTALDVGAGIGRVTKHVLIPAGFGRVDMTDASQRFLDHAVGYVGSKALGDRLCAPMHSFGWGGGRKWSLVWVQWCAIYLPDKDFVEFFRRAVRALDASPHACVVLKENTLRGDLPPIVDKADASLTRSDAHLKRLWAEAGCEVFAQEDAKGFPREIYPVVMYALRRAKDAPDNDS